MASNPVPFLFRKRLRYRLTIDAYALKWLVDIWTAVYLLIPAVILLAYSYVSFLHHAPAWLTPEWKMVPGLILGLWFAAAKLRSYLVYNDLVWLAPNPDWFASMLRRGFWLSILVNSGGTILLLIFLYPFYLHLFHTPVSCWIGAGIWTIVGQGAFMIARWYLQHSLKPRHLWLTQSIGLAAFLAVWFWGIMPLMAGKAAGMALPLAGGSLLVLLFITLLIRHWFPIRNWERVIGAEMAGDSRWLIKILGQNGDLETRRNGVGHLSSSRLGIPFRPADTVFYFMAKYLLRQRKYLNIYLQVLLVGSFTLIPGLPLWYISLFLAAAYVLASFLIISVIRDNLAHLKILAPGLSMRNIRQSRRALLGWNLLPWAGILLLAVWLNPSPWPEIISAMAIFTVLIFIAIRYVDRYTPL